MTEARGLAGPAVFGLMLLVPALIGGTATPDAPLRAGAASLWDAIVQAMPEADGGRRPVQASVVSRAPFGDAGNGPRLFRLHGCGACHAAPDVRGARGSVGPDLHGFAQRSYIAGVLANRPENLVAWLVDPPAHAPLTAMPDLGLTQAEALDLAAWLYAATEL